MALTKKQKEQLYEDFKAKIDSGELEYISAKESSTYRKEFWLQQECKCAVLKDPIKFKDSTLDHEHKLVSEPVGTNGKGLIRAVLHRDVNGLEGKIWNYWNRTSLKGKYKLQDVLRGLIEYYDMIEQGNLPIEQRYVYPSERPEKVEEKLTKNDRKKIHKYYLKVFPGRKKMIKLPGLLKGGKNPQLSKEVKAVLKKIDDYIRGGGV